MTTTRCPTCSTPLDADRIGGGATRQGPLPTRRVLLCTTCWQVWPADQPPAQRLQLVDQRRDLA